MYNFDPNCAVCGRPAEVGCECEADELENAITYAQEAIMSTALENIRIWVRNKARDFILGYFNKLRDHRQQTHVIYLQNLDQEMRLYNRNINRATLEHAEAELKHNIDEDWKASVQRYPEVLQYFYGLVEVSLPDENDTCVTEPPFFLDEEQLQWRSINMRQGDYFEAENPRECRPYLDGQTFEEDSGIGEGWERIEGRGSYPGRNRHAEDVGYERGHPKPPNLQRGYSRQSRY